MVWLVGSQLIKLGLEGHDLHGIAINNTVKPS
jgi:hypothetical protein